MLSNENVYQIKESEVIVPNAQSVEQPAVQFAGFWRRVIASLFDGAVIFFIGLAIGIALLFTKNSTIEILNDWIPLIIFWLYFSLMESSSKQATVGKIILGIKVTDVNGNRLSFGRATGRTFAKYISAFTFSIGFLMAGFTKRKQGLHDIIAKCLVIKHGKSHFWKAVLMAILSFIFLLASLGAYGYFILLPRFTQYLFTVSTVITEPTKISDIELLPERIIELPKEPVSLTEAEYDELLSSSITGFENYNFDGLTVNVGPAILEIGIFWDYDKDDPSVWIETRMISLPNFNLGSDDAKIIIDKVVDKNGQNIYNPDSNFETEIFQSFSFSEREYPVAHLYGMRTVHLRVGTNENDIKSVEGKFILQLPIDIQTLTFSNQDIGKTKTVGESKFTLKAIEGGQVLMNYKGPGNIYYASKAYNKDGEELKYEIKTTDVYGTENQSDNDFKDLYTGEVNTVKVIITSQVAEREYPFVIKDD